MHQIDEGWHSTVMKAFFFFFFFFLKKTNEVISDKPVAHSVKILKARKKNRIAKIMHKIDHSTLDQS